MTLLTLEGLDGSGKSSILEAIKQEYPNVVTTSEPTDREYGKLVRENLSQDTNELMDFYLFMADRMDHINNLIKPADNNGKLVVSDRYADSTRAYQPVALTGDDKPFDSPWDAKSWIEHTMAPWNYEPDLTIYVDISVDTAIERCEGDEKYEQREFLESVKDNYDALADSSTYGHRIVKVDGEQSEEDMVKSALGAIESFK